MQYKEKLRITWKLRLHERKVLKFQEERSLNNEMVMILLRNDHSEWGTGGDCPGSLPWYQVSTELGGSAQGNNKKQGYHLKTCQIGPSYINYLQLRKNGEKTNVNLWQN